MRVAIIGAGVIGLTSAFSLMRDGHDVEVLERAHPGAGASFGNAGWVCPSISTPLAAPGMLRQGLRHALDPDGALVIRPRLDPTFVRWLLGFARASTNARFEAGVEALYGLSSRTFEALDRIAAAGVRFEEHRAGLLCVARSVDALAWFQHEFAVLRRIGFTGRLDELTGDEARALEPALSDSVAAVVHCGIDRHVQPMSLVEGLVTHLAAHGVQVRAGAEAVRIDRATGGWRVALADGDAVAADAVVVAGALDTVRLVRPFGLRLPLVGGKGYSVTLPLAAGAPRHALYLCDAKVGVSPFAEGVRLAGLFELGARSIAPSERRVRQLVREAHRSVPAVGPEAPTGEVGWAAFRPATPDSLPFLGEVEGAPGLFVATGHGMLGVTLAPATGEAVAALIRGERPLYLEPFAVGRFR